ncbi:MAG: dual specificity protein phosphatase family protein [Acidobacteria bacterium]|nr:dual specificity protein phosphatase family protein [Acidobacteriota bacterium]
MLRRVWQWAATGAVMLAAAVAVGLAVAGAPVPSNATADAAAGHAWAQPLARPGLPNLHRVSPELYRGAQPTAAGMAQLRALGVRTVVNLRSSHSDDRLLEGAGLRYVAIPVTATSIGDDDVARFLRVVADPAAQPVFVHCQHGADRTGLMVAMYRVVVQDWPREAAIDEMVRGGFHFHGIYEPMLAGYVRTADLVRLRELAGLAPAAAAAER